MGQVWWFLFRLYVSPVAWALSDPQAATEDGVAQAEAGAIMGNHGKSENHGKPIGNLWENHGKWRFTFWETVT